MTAGIVRGAWTCGLIAGSFGRVTNLQEGERATWSQIRKEPGGARAVADMQGCGGKGEKCQGFRGLGLKACSPAHKRGAAPLCIPRRESVWGGGRFSSAKLKAIVKLLS